MRYLLLLAALPQLAFSAAVIRIDESRSLSISVAFRSSVGGTNIPSPVDGASRALELSLDGAVLAIGGELDKRLRLQINALRLPSTGAITVADAIVMGDVAPWLQIWAGRMLPPLDRASLTGPFFGVLYDPTFASAYPALLAGGRDEGVSLWGSLLDGRLKYQAGGYRGRPNLVGFPMFAARLSYSFWDPEPGFYAAGTYLGARKTLTLAVHGRYQRDGVGIKLPDNSVVTSRYAGFGADALAERDLGPVLGTAEAGFGYYDARGLGDPAVFEGTAAYLALAGMWMNPIGVGRLQLGARYQWQSPSGKPSRAKLDGVLNYFIAGQTIRLVGIASRELPPVGQPIYTARFAIQLVL